MTRDSGDLARRGYDAVSHRYRADDDAPAGYAGWVRDLAARLPDRADVLAAGLTTVRDEFVPEGDGGHQLLVAVVG